MEQSPVANDMQQRATDLAAKWSDHYGRASVGGRLMSEDLFKFIAALINMIDGFDEQVMDLINRNARLSYERDDLIDEGTKKEEDIMALSKRVVELQDRMDVGVSAFTDSQRSLTRTKAVIDNLIHLPY